MSRPIPPLDIFAALRLAIGIFWKDFAPIVLLGLIFVTLPAIALRLFAQDVAAPDPTLGTVVETLRWLFIMIFLCAVTGGLLSRAETPGKFIRAGLATMQPGLVVALLIGVLLVTCRIVFLLFSRLIHSSDVASFLFLAACVAMFALWVLAIPAALIERQLPLIALRRSAALTRGNRWRLAGLFFVIAVALLPPILLARLVIFGPDATPIEAAAIVAEMTLASPGLWIGQLTNLLVIGLLSVVPAVLYMILSAHARR